MLQVLKKRLSLVEPTVRTDGGFEYEEGEGLDDDEVAANRAKLPLALSALPGGGLGQGVTAHVEDQVQEFKVAIEITHKVRRRKLFSRCLGWCMYLCLCLGSALHACFNAISGCLCCGASSCNYDILPCIGSLFAA